MRFRTHHLFGPGAIGQPVQPWAAVAGWAALLLPLPAVVWRLAMVAGVPTGFADAEFYRTEALGYVVGLEAVQVGVAVLCFGLIRRWGEVWPRWLPGLGGRTIHRLLPTVLGTVGVAIMSWTLGALLIRFSQVAFGGIDGWLPTDGMSATEATILLIAYVPFFCWPIAIAVALVGYWLRRSPRHPPPMPAKSGPVSRSESDRLRREVLPRIGTGRYSDRRRTASGGVA